MEVLNFLEIQRILASHSGLTYFIDKIKTQKEGEEDKEFIENVPFNDIAMFILALIIPSFIKRHYKYVEGK